jgi:hypothetical protein
MRRKPGGQQSISAGKIRRIEQPSEKEGSIRIRGQINRIQDDRDSYAFLLKASSIGML